MKLQVNVNDCNALNSMTKENDFPLMRVKVNGRSVMVRSRVKDKSCCMGERERDKRDAFQAYVRAEY